MISEIFQRPAAKVFLSLIFRVSIYAVLLGGLAYGMLWGAVAYGPDFFDEVGPVETLECVFVLMTAVVFLVSGRIDRRKNCCTVMIAGFLSCLFIRELDYFLDMMVCRHAWKWGVTVVLILMATYAFRHFEEMHDSVASFISNPSFGIFLSGLLVLVVFSRLFGYGDFWKELLNPKQYRVAKTIVEEGVEQMGYFLLLISSFEYLHDARVYRQQIREQDAESV